MNRPKAVDLKTVDPCTLITPEKKTALGLRTVQSTEPDPDYGEGSKACGASYEDRKFTWAIETVLNGGVDRLKRTVGEAKLTTAQIAGYPAYLNKRESPNSAGACDIYLDVHDGQLLLVTAIAGWGTDSTVDGACERGKMLGEAAGAVLATK